jgi:hypothetical protein
MKCTIRYVAGETLLIEKDSVVSAAAGRRAASLIDVKTPGKWTFESGRLFDVGSPGPGGLFSKNEDVTARTSQRCRRGGRRVASA